MPPRVPISHLVRTTQKPFTYTKPLCVRIQPRRLVSSDEKPLPKKDGPGPGPNQEQLPHISEEAAAIDKTMGKQAPEIEQGSNVQDVLNRQPGAKDNAPEILKDKNKSPNTAGSRSYSTSARKMNELSQFPGANEVYDSQFSASMLGDSLPPWKAEAKNLQEKVQGIKFDLPELPIGKHENMKYRYDSVVKQVTMLLVKDGKLARAQSNMMRILNILRTSPPPNLTTAKPLIAGAPPAAHLPLNPIMYLTLAIDSVAPLTRMKSLKGMAGGGQALQVPQPLSIHRRRRTAVMWILDACEKKVAKGSGKGMFAQKFADEVIAIVEGRGNVWAKRESAHKLAVLARANVTKAADFARNKR